MVFAVTMGAMFDEEGDARYRKSIMARISGHTGAIAQIAKGKISHDSGLQ